MAKGGFKPRPRRCDVCGVIYTQKNALQVRCAECQKKHVAEKAKQKKTINCEELTIWRG